MKSKKSKLMVVFVVGVLSLIIGQVLGQIFLQLALHKMKQDFTTEINKLQNDDAQNNSKVLELLFQINRNIKMGKSGSDTKENSSGADNCDHTEKTVSKPQPQTQQECSEIGTGEMGIQIHNENTGQLPRNCADVYKMGGTTSDIYIIYTPDGRNVSVYCDMDTAGGGWIVFQRRKDGSVLFNRTWNGYKYGLGFLCGEFWLGNDYISTLTSNGSFVLRVDLWSFGNGTRYAQYEDFVLNDESDNYRLNIGKFSGTVPKQNGLTNCNKVPFTTIDKDNDECSANCAIVFGGGGGFWYKACEVCALNSAYFHSEVNDYHGINWFGWLKRKTLKGTEMKFRPKDYN